MKFSINSEIFEKWPNLQIGFLVLKNIDNKSLTSDITELLREVEVKTKSELENSDLNQMPEITMWRKAYKEFGSDPHDFRSSVEALLRRVRAGKPLPEINPLVDLYNYLSIKYKVTAGAEDLDKIVGNISLTFSDGSESGLALGSNEEESCYRGEIIYRDDKGFICRRWNWREADRTKIEPDTKNAVLVFESILPDFSLESINNEAKTLIENYLHGQVDVVILNREKVWTEWS